MRTLLIKILIVILLQIVIILIQEFWKQLKKRAYFGG